MKYYIYLLVAYTLSGTLFAQNDTLVIPNLPLELKHEKAIRGQVFFTYIAIVDARTKGQATYDLGRFYGNSLGLTWAPVKDKGLIAFSQWLTAFITLYKDYKLEILKNTSESLEFKMKNIGEEYIIPWSSDYKKENWLTVEEYFDFYRGFFISTCNYMGFKAESEVKEGWLYLKISD
jgi:hypothetical protein